MAIGFTRDGRIMPLDEVRDDVVQTLGLDRRQTMVDEWLTGLRRRATITDVYLTESAGSAYRPLMTKIAICSRSNAAWLTIGATTDRRRRYDTPQNAPSRPVANAASTPWTMWPAPNADARDHHAHGRSARATLEAASG